MTLEQLAKSETELYSTILDLQKKEQTEALNEKQRTVFALYRQVHRHYSYLAKEQEEALKRGLFIQWYACTEPNYLTGIEQLDEEAEKNIINIVEEKIQNNTLDSELKWMLNYYADWDYVFDRFKNREGLAELIANRTDGLPIGLVIDKAEMNKRGQMGIYWNSLNHFTNTETNASS
ncbi:MAG: hypothetical protein KBB37_04910 [Bacteroidia bacterium]|jgi:hypothetical protein|nr:hypothetical protein [Bacteroidia bacterium]MBP9179868.1 hypothetical protein [Bacteroidia bacterium]MBP9724230.1 hypothetical protein [Bacteroidia bacterium]